MTREAVQQFPRRHAATRRFTLGSPRSFRVAPDGESVLFLRSTSETDAVNRLWLHRIGESAPRLLCDPTALDDVDDGISAAEMARRERVREQAGGIVGYAVDDDFATAYFVLGGALRAVGLADGDHRTLATAGAVFDPRPRPVASGADTRRHVAYVSGSGLRITDGEDDREVPGTYEPGDAVTWGSAEFVAAEEMNRQRGFWWSPDGSSLAVTRVDVGPVEQWWISSPESPSDEPRGIRYPAAGTANADVQLWIVDPATGPAVEVDWRRDGYEYLYDVSWSERLLCTVHTRDQSSMAVLEVDPATGTCSEVAVVTDPRWVEPGPGTPDDENGRLWLVYDDAVARRLHVDGHGWTGDDVQVRSLVDHDDSTAIITMSTTDPAAVVVAGVGSDGRIDPRSRTDGYAAAVGKRGTLVVSQATVTDATTHEIRWHDSTVSNVESYGGEPGFPCAPDFHVLGRRELRTALFLPDGHDGAPLPVLMDPYGGPHAQRVLRARNALATSQWFAEQGFAVVVVDGRGTPGRGPAFEREVWGDLAAPVLDDQVDALHALAEQRDELDLARVGIRGWSFGGYLAALAVLRRPDVFHAAVAGAPVTDWRLYDTFYTERYLGHPAEHPEHYVSSGLLNEAASLTRPLMLIHGLADDNVVAAHTLLFSRALLEAGRAHEVLPLSGVTHMTPQEQVAENLLHLQRDFLLRHVAGRDPV